MSSYQIGVISRNLFRPTYINNLKSYKVNNVIRRYASLSQSNNQKQPKSSTFKLALIGAAFGAAAGTVYSVYNQWHDKSAHIEHEKIVPAIIDKLPKVRITKRVVNPQDDSDLEIILFQYQTCPFCCKVRSYLDYMGISYSIVEVDAVLRQDIKWSQYKKVPMALVRQNDGRYVQLTDSSTIISIIASYLNNKEQDIGELAQYYPQITYFDDKFKKRLDIMNKYFLMYHDKTPVNLSKEEQDNDRKWRTWADNHLVHLISPNCYRSISEAFETFEWFSEAGEWNVHFPQWEHRMMVYLGATAMWAISKIIKKRHGLTDDVRSHIYEALNDWTNEINKRHTEFMGGNTPNLADISVFGVLSSMEGCEAFKDCLKNTKIGPWFYGVKEIINKNRGKVVREKINSQIPDEVNIV